MMKKYGLTAIFMIAVTIVTAQVNVFHGSLKEGIDKANNEGKTLVAMVSTTWCGPCKAFVANVLPQKKVGDYVNARYVFMKFVINEADPDHIEDSYGIAFFPTFLLLNGEGHELTRKVGGMDGDKFVAWLKTALDDPLIALRANFEKEPLKYAEEYVDALQKAFMSERIDGVLEKVYPLMDKNAFYTLYFKYLDRVPLDHEIITYMLDHKETLASLVGNEAYIGFMKKKGEAAAWNISLEKERAKQDESFDIFTTRLKSNPEINGGLQTFVVDNRNAIIKKDIPALLQAVEQEGKATGYSGSEQENIMSLILFVAGKNLPRYEDAIMEVAKRLDGKTGKTNIALTLQIMKSKM